MSIFFAVFLSRPNEFPLEDNKVVLCGINEDSRRLKRRALFPARTVTSRMICYMEMGRNTTLFCFFHRLWMGMQQAVDGKAMRLCP